MKTFLLGMGLMAFAVLVSVVQLPLKVGPSQLILSDRRAQQLRLPKSPRGLPLGNGSLRIAAFGSSIMWGAGLENRFDSLPFLLSDQVDNYAMFAGGPNYPAVCTQTIIGDDKVYDVIFLEYWLKARQGVPELARRLRERYPRAMIFFVKVWSPLHARRRGKEGENEVTFEEWRNSKSLPDNINLIVQALEADDGDWYFPEHLEADLILSEARQAVDGYNIRILQKETGKDTLMFFLHFFNHQNTHLSPLGHEYLANMTKVTIKRKLELEGTSTAELPNAAERGNWGRGDKCHMWYTTGGYSKDYSPELIMHKFDQHMGKFALEVTAPGWLVVSNDFRDERTLYLSFLATVEGVYPEVTAKIGETGAPLLLVPINVNDTNHAQNARTLPIGKIPPGDTKIYITPQGLAENFFRLVGVTLTNEIAVPVEFGFGPIFNH